jgi:hypothetical protein
MCICRLYVYLMYMYTLYNCKCQFALFRSGPNTEHPKLLCSLLRILPAYMDTVSVKAVIAAELLDVMRILIPNI